MVLALLGIGALFAARSALLWWGSYSLTQATKSLQRTGKGPQYFRQCQQEVGSDINVAITPTPQIRFLSDTEYMAEILCDGFSADPIIVERYTLPIFVSKVPGSAGLILGADKSGVTLTVFAKELEVFKSLIGYLPDFLVIKKQVILENGILSMSSEEVDLGQSPVSTCAGYGFQCCNEQTDLGVGERLEGATGCTTSCYSSCTRRPVLLSFNTQPILDPRSRTVSVPAGVVVTWSYVADAGQDPSLTAWIDFGDGKHMELQGESGTTTHAYTCALSECRYKVEISLTDAWGVTSAPLSISTMTVVVRGQ
ncbi:MAG: hypothetical protein COY80_02560 [Candidatus Pacebacteria bacterium CG_4_10_14_0_8_um_filter_42_14]|nr:MAG: hypothetical protein COY80_02560 [Candidatus Pacebacteria bacterium CG_4_10_14_0_8_um_filter_42_14]